MGRSVSVPRNATVVTYRFLEPQPWEDEDEDGNTVMMEPTDEDFQLEFEYMVEDLQYHARQLWPSLRKCDEWLGSEDHALLENDMCWMGISEYCCCVATWIVPKTDYWANSWSGEDIARANLCDRWVNQIASRFHKNFGGYVKVATFSNGEAWFEKKKEVA